jgi:hypothetical protein
VSLKTVLIMWRECNEKNEKVDLNTLSTTKLEIRAK